MKKETRRRPCSPCSNGYQPNGKKATKRYRYRVWWQVSCSHGIRWVKQDVLDVSSGGCRKCAGELRKTRGLPWNEKPFYCLIFQPRTCKDCGKGFETLYSTQQRCCPCQKEWKHGLRHYGSKCRKYGVPFEKGISAISVFRRDNWTCWLCGLSAPKELRGTFEDLAPELEHKIELTVPNSPGHVSSNVACSHRKCNREKEIQRVKNNT